MSMNFGRRLGLAAGLRSGSGEAQMGPADYMNITTLDPVIGTPGFGAPDVEALDCVEIRSEADANSLAQFGITIKNDQPWSGNLVARIWLNKAICARKVIFHFRRGCGNSSIILDRINGLSGTIVIAAQNCTLIDCGNKYRASNITLVFWSDGGLFYWGQGSTSNGLFTELHGDGKAVLFGEDCMLATEIIVRPTDMHAIFDLDSREVTNRSVTGRIEIGPHVWLGQRVFVGKDVIIGRGSIVGSGSSATRSLPPFSLSAGAPAKVLRSNVSWSRALYPTDDMMTAEIGNLLPADSFCPDQPAPAG